MSFRNKSPFNSSLTKPDQMPKFLSDTQINLQGMDDPKEREFVPPNTPKGLILDYLIASLPGTFPRLTNSPLPIVSKVGVKGAIEAMSILFKCEDFKVNFVQFWFLDIITDCLWRLQDEYHFPVKFQNVVLEWVLYFFNLMKAPDLNLSRGKVFRIFREAIRLCENRVESGVETFPSPEDVFVLNRNNLENTEIFEDDVSESDSSIFDEEEENGEFLLVRREGVDEVYRLPEKVCPWYTRDEDCLSSSEESSTEPSIEEKPSTSESQNKSTTTVTSSTVESLDDEQIEYYKPDLGTPSRFRSRIFDSGSDEISVISYLEEDEDGVEEAYSDHSNEPEIFKWMSIPRKLPHGPCPSRIFDPVEEEKKKEMVEEEIKRSWQDYNLWHIKRDHINNTGDEERSEYDGSEEIMKKLKMFLKKIRKEDNKNESKFINTCVLLAIKEFINDYFYDSFQFTLLTIAIKHPHRLLAQELNTNWNVPKLFKGELKRPAVKIPKPPKKQKIEKTKKTKEEKGSKGSTEKKKKKKDELKDSKEKKKKKGEKSSKKGDKGSKEKIQKGKEDKSSKKSKGKGEKGIKKSKKEKDEKTSKKSKKDKKDKKLEEKSSFREEKKQREEDKLKMEQLKRLEENKKYVFPLKDAVNDNFFQTIFDQWQPKSRKTKDKDKSSKKDKDSKKSDKKSKKSDKDSKKTDKDSKKSDKDSKKTSKSKKKKKEKTTKKKEK